MHMYIVSMQLNPFAKYRHDNKEEKTNGENKNKQKKNKQKRNLNRDKRIQTSKDTKHRITHTKQQQH